MQADLELEFTQVQSNAWAAFHRKAPLWRTKGRLHAKLRILHLSVSVSFAWSSGTRHWMAGELQRIKAMQVCMTRRIAGWFPYPEEEWAAFSRRCSTWSQVHGDRVGIPRGTTRSQRRGGIGQATRPDLPRDTPEVGSRTF